MTNDQCIFLALSIWAAGLVAGGYFASGAVVMILSIVGYFFLPSRK